MGPAVLVKLVLGLNDGGQFGLGKEGVVHQNSVREGRECGGTSDGIAVKDGAFLVTILAGKYQRSAAVASCKTDAAEADEDNCL